MSSGFRETGGQYSSDRMLSQKVMGGTSQASREPYRGMEHWSYGIITDIDEKSYQVKVQVFGKYEGKEISSGSWLPLLTQQEEIFFRWGRLRKGMYARVHWRGQKEVKHGFVEVIGDETTNFTQQEDRDNELTTGPVKFLGGGLTSF